MDAILELISLSFVSSLILKLLMRLLCGVSGGKGFTIDSQITIGVGLGNITSAKVRGSSGVRGYAPREIFGVP